MWDVEDEEVTQPEAPPAEEEPAPEAAAEEATPEEAEPPPPESVVKGFEPKKLIFQHWVRPKFLQYRYLYDYQHNYYDDVINYLDKRNKGVAAEKPRAQTWGERALRTYLSYQNSNQMNRMHKDSSLLRHISTGARFHRYHSKSIIARKYSTLGFTTVSI